MASDLPQHGSAQSDPRREGNAVAAPPEYHSQTHANVSFATGTPQPPGLLNRKKQRSSKTKTDKIVTKSISTPHLRDNIMSESEADKKRNKLGYQRISIACAHCRRRKIRCVVAEDDPEQRCNNCIRLKKECVFYPVDQQAVIDARSDSSSKTNIPSAPSSAVSTSPLQPGGARGFDQHAFMTNYPPTAPPPPVSTAYQGVPLVPSTDVPTQGYSPHDYSFQGPAQPASQWGPPDAAAQSRQASIAHTPSAQQSFTRYNSIPAPDVAPFPGPEPYEQLPSNASQVAYGGYDEHVQQPPHAWQHQSQAGRPMQYSNYPQHYSTYQQAPQLQNDYRRPQAMPAPANPMMPMPASVPSHGQQQYAVHHGQRSASAPGTPQMPYPGAHQVPWYPSAPSHSPAHDQPRKLPSNYPPPGGFGPG
ncbi:hypothetical protein CB0940_01583 [Cercospora beticola]|uniref:Zn(2)-C6 fungal-type domain-containing protein n=1 Tax=Cercospora beticola TaxID=122368 RepID=A0A2G5I9H8_CERBT|nr:hypothetical protein CB0940_01583 [Cercospora beticola]PIB01477.1 hypothetical protein CB0940_01583 [Cercospora beticola]WPA97024.1 hypothetical protein RHO25_001632 [Cercospora beticola]CAK1354578.1 unnamed protein product [Cercospora beticola]